MTKKQFWLNNKTNSRCICDECGSKVDTYVFLCSYDDWDKLYLCEKCFKGGK